ncbi:hypothetical protein M407DRAFT_75939 [Tulasnella calospora MUT 4182]|uniref:Thioredoxin domain-containing protein n=1 Tax=Tulasnella calospora MUT 4182 TaxID=1051891 RepID=A0A0C3KUW7_9AGAM|nr:hypothetical protein M407DRAFT_75939 [Tulasnella calospora MUT 4182]
MATLPQVVSPDQWLESRLSLLAKEKEFAKLQSEIRVQRKSLPCVEVTKPYAFTSLTGKVSLSDLFDGKNQLIVYHFMFGPQSDAGCPHCSFLVDNLTGINPHLSHGRNANLVFVSRAPIDKIEAYQKRLGWDFKWYSVFEDDTFNKDYGVAFEEGAKEITYNYEQKDASKMPKDLPGVSVFVKGEEGKVYHTYSGYGEFNHGAETLLDCTPLGRGDGEPESWVRRNDEYGV